MPSARLDDRAVLEVSGDEARAFLDRLVTCEVATSEPGSARYGALLTPQGKIIADFVIAQRSDPEALLLDTPAACAPEIIKRLTLYRLRAKVAIADRSGDLAVVAGWDGGSRPADALSVSPDPRRPELGWRAVVPAGSVQEGEVVGPEAYHAHRVAVGVPEMIRDFPAGDAFPHEAIMDQLGGVDFRKGCYVGQEVVSRMQHRGTARTRIVRIRYVGEEARQHPPGEVSAGGRVLGRTGGSFGPFGLAMLRVDRAGEALASGEAILAGGVPIRFDKPDWVRFAYPGEGIVTAA